MCDLNQQGECCLAYSEAKELAEHIRQHELAANLWTRLAEGSAERAKRWAVSPAFRWEPNA